MKSMTDYFNVIPYVDEHVNATVDIQRLAGRTSKQVEETNSTFPNQNNGTCLLEKDGEVVGKKSISPEATLNKKKKKVLNLKLKNHTSNSLEETTQLKSHDSHDKTQKRKRFDFKIKMKSNDNCEESPNISGNASTALIDNDCSASTNKALKSPQSTMFKYLICQSKSLLDEKSDLSEPNRDISQLKLSTKCSKPCTENNVKTTSHPSKPRKIKSRNLSVPESETTKRMKGSTSSDCSHRDDKRESQDNMPAEKSIISKDKQPSSVSKRKLSLLRASSNGNVREKNKSGTAVTENVLVEEASSEAAENGAIISEELSFNNSIHVTLKDNFCKSNSNVCQSSTNSDVPPQASKKCKLNPTEEFELGKNIHKGNVEDTNKFCDYSKDDSISLNTNKNASPGTPTDDPIQPDPRGLAVCKENENKRNSLMKYFSKMSKEEAMSIEEKVELKVKVMVHSPPTTPSKKKKRRSVKSLPGGSTALVKKKVKSLKLTNSEDEVNAISVIGVEEIKVANDIQHAEHCGLASSFSLKGHGDENEFCPKENKPLKTPKTLKRKSLKKEVGQRSAESSKCSIDDAAGNPSDLSGTSTHMNAVTKSPAVPSVRSWKMRVSFLSTPAPSSRGTLHEEESECEEMLSERIRKKRRVHGKNRVTESLEGCEPVQDKTSVASEKKASVPSKEAVKVAPILKVNLHKSKPEKKENDSTQLNQKPSFGTKGMCEGHSTGKSFKDVGKLAPLFRKKDESDLEDTSDTEEMFFTRRRTQKKVSRKMEFNHESSEGSDVSNEVQIMKDSSFDQNNKAPEVILEKEKPSSKTVEKLAPVFKKKDQSDLEDTSDTEVFFTQRRTRKVSRKMDFYHESSEGSDCSNEVQIMKSSSFDQNNRSPEVILEKEKPPSKTDIKIAPLFNIKARNNARQQFLQSGIPEQMKRLVEVQRSFEDQECEMFPKESHIQQIDSDRIWNLDKVELSLIPEKIFELPLKFSKISLGDFTSCVAIHQTLEDITAKLCEGPRFRITQDLPFSVMKPVLKCIKSDSPTFKIVNTFKALQKKCFEDKLSKATLLSILSPTRPKRKSASSRKPKGGTTLPSAPLVFSQVWTEKYKPTTSTEIVGNTESVRRLKKWLEAWRQFGEDTNKHAYKGDLKSSKRRKKTDDDDFVVEDDSSDETSQNTPISFAVLLGPTGCGKTCTVYAVARDLGYKVLEVNVSEKRNGKVVLSKLSEATQSHQVQTASSAEKGFNALFSVEPKTSKKRKIKQRSSSAATTKTEDEKGEKMSLILFEDVDIMFEEEDEGFLAAVSNIISSSKRPVVLTATDQKSCNLSRFSNYSCLVLEFFPSSDSISTWLQLVSLLEGIYVSCDAVKALVTVCGGDFRRALLQMQLWVTSGGNNLPMRPLLLPVNSKSQRGDQQSAAEDSPFDDETALSADGVEDGCNHETPIPKNTDCLGALLGRNDVSQQDSSQTERSYSPLPFLEIPFPLDIGHYWWNIPRVLSLKQISHEALPTEKHTMSSAKSRLLDDSFIESFCSDEEYCAESVSSETVHFSDQTSKLIVKAEGEATSLDSKTSSTITNDVMPTTSSKNDSSSMDEMIAMTRQIVCISTIDLFSTISNLPESRNNIEPVSRISIAKDGVSLFKDNAEGPNYTMESTTRFICHWLGEGSMHESRCCLLSKHLQLGTRNPVADDFSFCLPSAEEKEWRAAHVNTVDQLLDVIPYYMHLDNTAIFLDYIPTLRTFCRFEKFRNSKNTKRRNRFYHYLKSIGVNLSDTQVELLCQTMCSFSSVHK